MNIARRLAKIETVLPNSKPAKPTREEQQLMVYLVAKAVLRTDRSPALRERVTALVEETERDIRWQAARSINDQLLSHIEYVEHVWVASARQLPFIPPIIGLWSDDWFMPDLTAKRLAVRRHPAIVALIGDKTGSPWGSQP